MSYKCESGSSCFQPGEGPSRGLLRDCTILPMDRFTALPGLDQATQLWAPLLNWLIFPFFEAEASDASDTDLQNWTQDLGSSLQPGWCAQCGHLNVRQPVCGCGYWFRAISCMQTLYQWWHYQAVKIKPMTKESFNLTHISTMVYFTFCRFCR